MVKISILDEEYAVCIYKKAAHLCISLGTTKLLNNVLISP